ncbi:uncharacterized protein TRIADDRAFT_54552 [Trichoplax adhaerens]|uniref:DML1/Misato tubulin domain-containing protein n=1 Tax=Trichoplax adhaerens TaxID=10228 RepID=B3RSC7_TRIAD|nr:hypothetical protein TRIADDRAFT_54552 [Trichoplax adhaerens]EDV27033.1 hypothetical protein TRIADDRAFT_54552 [Trichoplax adhaerens]|eukprot:XP_002111029.1 hypothetical protein TRIADDRAFT_54552 [Trichoplax adhaerens]
MNGTSIPNNVDYTVMLLSAHIGSLNSLKEEGNLYNTKESDSQNQLPSWSGSTEQHYTEPALKNQFLQDLEYEDNEALNSAKDKDTLGQAENSKGSSSHSNTSRVNRDRIYNNLDSEISVWSDFLRIHWHPKSLCIVPQFMHNATFAPFDTFTYGLNVYDKMAEEYEDKLHFFTEECDHLQGFHILTDIYDGFGGLGYKIIEDLRSEFRSKAIININPFPVVNHAMDASTDLTIINTVLSLCNYHEYCNATLPLSLNTSAAVGCIEPVKFNSIKYDKICSSLSSNFTADHLYDALTEAERKILSLSTGFPLPIDNGASSGTFFESLNGDLDSILSCISPEHKERNVSFSRYVTLRGITTSPFEGNRSVPSREMSESLQHNNTPKTMLQKLLFKSYPNSLSLCSIVNDACNVSAPFPSIFSKNSTKEFYKKASNEKELQNLDACNMAAIASLESTCASQHYLKSLLNQAEKVAFRRYHQFKETGMEEDTYSEALDNLANLAEAYSVDRSI